MQNPEAVSDAQKAMSKNGEKDIRHYQPALKEAFDKLSDDEKAEYEALALKWNSSALPDDVQRRYELL